LTEPSRHEAALFTRDHGPIPIYTTSFYCRGCYTRYYPNYCLHDKASQRTYYGGIPQYIQSSKKIFVERSLCERFCTQMAMSWTSATNCARIYNAEFDDLRASIKLPAGWKFTLKLDTDNSSDAFYLYSLLLDHSCQGSFLKLPHHAPNNTERLHDALELRNMQMVGPGQPEWNHACSGCTKLYKNSDGTAEALRSTVTDGVTLGHSCCAYHDCKEPLPTNRHIFCQIHQDLYNQCAVTDCTSPVEKGYRTCADPSHRSLEKLKVIQPEDAMSTSVNTVTDLGHAASATLNEDPNTQPMETNPEEIEIQCDKKTNGTTRRLKARFGRRRTHNEELCVASCGMILGRATFYGAEGLNGVRLFWKRLFPTQHSLPNVLWYDNNCGMQAMLQADNDHYFDNCALPVDVFHFKSKHKEQDKFCGMYCNPHLWRDLITEDGTWLFNSSAAEQTNAWFGGYLAIVRDMRVERYNFFLDEMIRRRNEYLR
ncbi:hypothetical protein M422DRAFT_163649, partial [Sphaerobolus stellatus SS14]